ncbi:MAG TPA: membrane protein insertion efficiency factor YidD [Patescibacteria group bacterium]|nr:membrane protein insertion efficiency factor YidD [Patescibacteria group bacterium]
MRKLVLLSIRFYQKLPLLESHSACRFTPRCSEYTYQAIDKYGILPGVWLGLKRIVRCHPWSPGGPDPLR